MRTTITLDDDLLADAAELTGITEKSALVQWLAATYPVR